VPVALGEDPKGIDEARVEQLADAFALLAGESRLSTFCFGLARSSSVWATLRSPQMATGFLLWSALT